MASQVYPANMRTEMAEKHKSKIENESQFKNAFLASLTSKVSVPHKDWPNTHCWTRASISSLFSEIRQALSEGGLRSYLSNASLISWLSSIGILHKVETETKRQVFYLLDAGSPATDFIDPLELLVASCPAGIICYFTAVSFHSLTTQPVAHHHIAKLVATAASRTALNEARPIKSATDGLAQKPIALGRQLFRHNGIPYYEANRAVRLIPGVQSRAHGSRVILKITTYEQTLLDTLYKPFHCGGPEVVFEAWHTAHQAKLIDEDRIVHYIEQMNYPATARRAAVMLRLIGYSPGNALKASLQKVRDSIKRSSDFVKISLLPGLPYKNLDEEWLVLTP